MDLLLHIGTGKTGSTSVQGFMQANADRMAQQGIMLPNSLGERNHRNLPAIVQSGPLTDSYLRMRGIRDPQDQQAARAAWLDAFRAEIANAQALRCIISAEHLSFLKPQEIKTLQGILSEMFDRIRVLVYLRDPVDYAVSMYDTAIKTGGTLIAPRPPERGGETDYEALLKAWCAAFGQDALTVRLFDRRELFQGDIIADFAQVAGIDSTNFTVPETENSSLNLLGQALLTRINRKIPKFDRRGRPNPQRGQIHRVFERHFGTGPKYVPDAALLKAYRDCFSGSNEWVRQTFFPDRATLFVPRDYPPPQTLSASDAELEQISNLITTLWKRQ